MNLAAGQLPEQPAVHRAEGEFARLGQCARAWDVVQNPMDFCGRKICVYQQACALLDHLATSIAHEAFAEIRGAAILPDDCVADGLARLAVPDDGGLTLVGDSD